MARSSRTCSPARPWRRIGEWVRRGRPRELCSRALAKGTRPLGFPSPYLAGTFRKDDRPPTHFFVKKKFIPIGGAESTTQKVPSGLSYAHTLCGGGTLCHARNPPAIRFAPGPPPFNKGGKKFLRLTEAVQTLCGAGSTPHAGGSFFLYEKSVLRESDYLCGRKPEVCTDLTPPLFRS